MKKYFLVYLGAFIQIFAITCILKPNHLTVGGITGLSLSIEKLIGINYTYIYYFICLLIIVFAKIYLGKEEVKRILLLSLTYPVLLIIGNKFSFNFIEEGTEKIVICIYYAIFMGIGTGLILREGFSQGSSDTLSKIVNKKILPFLDLSRVIFIIDLTILLISLITFSKTVVLYAIIIQFIYSRVLAFVLFGSNDRVVKMVIISPEIEQIKMLFRYKLKYNFSIDYVYNKDKELKEKIIYIGFLKDCIQVKNLIHKIDKDAFINIVPTIGAWGKDNSLQKFEED